MSLSERNELNVRTAGEKAQKADEFLTRSQIRPGLNVYFDYLSNWDIIINAINGGVGTAAVPRDLLCYLKLKTRPSGETEIVHLDIQDTITGGGVDASDKQYMGTAVYQDIHHNWNLPSKDHFVAVWEDLRDGVSPSANATKSYPAVVGINVNTVRVWATDPKTETRFDPRVWVDSTDGLNVGSLMINTRLPQRGEDASYERPNQVGVEIAPFYAMKLVEITDLAVTYNQNQTSDTVQ